MSNQNDKYNVTKDGERWKLTLTRHFNSQEEATSFGDSQTADQHIDEPPASETTIEQAKEINSQVISGATPAPGEAIPSGGGQERDSGEQVNQSHAPHEMGGDPAKSQDTDKEPEGARKTATADKSK